MKRPWTSRRRVFKSHLRPPQRCHVSCCRLFSADCVRKAASAGTGHRALRCQPFLDKQSREGWNTRGERWREVSSLQSLLVFYLKRRTQTTFWGEGQPGEEDLNTWKQNERSFVKKTWKDSRFSQNHSRHTSTVRCEMSRKQRVWKQQLHQRNADWGSAGQTLPATVVEPWPSRVVSIYILTSNLITVTAAGYFSNIGQSWGAADGLSDADLRVSHFYFTADHEEWICPLSGCSTNACLPNLRPRL